MRPHIKDALLSLLPLLLSISLIQFNADYNAFREFTIRSNAAKIRRKKKRVNWTYISQRISDKQFRRMFRMTRECFLNLCNLIISHVGDEAFKSESYLEAYLKGKNSMHLAHEQSCGGYISGETKLAITLRILAGGDPCDLAVLFDITALYCNQIMLFVLKNWINATNIGCIDMHSYLKDLSKLSIVSEGFSQRSNGVLLSLIHI